MKNFKKLRKDEMRNIFGGVSGPSTCTVDCGKGISVTCSGPQCSVSDTGCLAGDGTFYSCPGDDD